MDALVTERLSRGDWIAVALRELAEHGHNALTANRLASVLGVSRGSFYWHFRNVDDFESGVLARWRERVTDGTIEKVERLATATERLEALVRTSLSAEARLERAVRSWAMDSPTVAKFVSGVDAKRIDYIRQQLIAIGVDQGDVDIKALILNWASIGMIMRPTTDSTKSVAADTVVRLFT